MDLQKIKGISFGLTSGTITTLGMIVGLNASTGSRKVVIGGILLIAICDALSDSMGMHVSQESLNKHTQQEVWTSTISTFLSKFLFALTFMLPFLLFSDLQTSILVSILYGLTLIGVASYFIGKNEHEKPLKVVLEHLAITLIVVLITFLVGTWVEKTFV